MQPNPCQPDPAVGLGDVIADMSRSIHDLQATVEEILNRLRGATKDHYTVDEVAEQTGRAPYTVRTWIREGRLRAVRVDGSGPRGRLLVPREELRKLIADGKGERLSSVTAD
jgi:excisionase family DNA binding protein